MCFWRGSQSVASCKSRGLSWAALRHSFCAQICFDQFEISKKYNKAKHPSYSVVLLQFKFKLKLLYQNQKTPKYCDVCLSYLELSHPLKQPSTILFFINSPVPEYSFALSFLTHLGIYLMKHSNLSVRLTQLRKTILHSTGEEILNPTLEASPSYQDLFVSKYFSNSTAGKPTCMAEGQLNLLGFQAGWNCSNLSWQWTASRWHIYSWGIHGVCQSCMEEEWMPCIWNITESWC